MATYFYWLPGKGFFAGTHCFDKDGKVLSLSMVSEVGHTDVEDTPVTYIRKRPAKPSERTIKQLNFRHPNMTELSAEDAINKLLSRGRTLDELAAHGKKYGIEIITQEDLEAYKASKIPRVVEDTPKETKKATTSSRKSKKPQK